MVATIHRVVRFFPLVPGTILRIQMDLEANVDVLTIWREVKLSGQTLTRVCLDKLTELCIFS